MAEVKDAAAVRFFPPGIPLVAILVGTLLHRLVPLDLGFSLPAPGHVWLGWGIAFGGVLLFGLWPIVLFRRGGQDENPWKPTPKIETSGPFRLTRNPMYLQMVLICLGVGVAKTNWWLLLLVPVVAWLLSLLVIKPEEEYLERKFGAVYLDYKSKVRRWI